MADPPKAEDLIAERMGDRSGHLEDGGGGFWHNPLTTAVLLLLGTGVMLSAYRGSTIIRTKSNIDPTFFIYSFPLI